MKKLLLAAASISVMAVAAPVAYAAGSTSNVTQAGSGQTASVDQTGSLLGSLSNIDQSNANNTADVTQADDGTSAAFVNDSDVDQTGDGNTATVNQDSLDAAGQLVSVILQSGDGNTADVSQTSDDQDSTVTQISSGNSATVVQGDSAITAGNSPSFIFSNSNTSEITQDGVGGHVANVTQRSQNAMSTVTQFGEMNTANVEQGEFSQTT